MAKLTGPNCIDIDVDFYTARSGAPTLTSVANFVRIDSDNDPSLIDAPTTRVNNSKVSIKTCAKMETPTGVYTVRFSF